MKTPEEIKKGLLCCCHDADCDICPYVESGCGNNELKADALSYIQLESELEAVKRERDAAVKDIEYVISETGNPLIDCMVCKYKDRPICENCEWEWRGVCQENTEVQEDD